MLRKVYIQNLLQTKIRPCFLHGTAHLGGINSIYLTNLMMKE